MEGSTLAKKLSLLSYDLRIISWKKRKRNCPRQMEFVLQANPDASGEKLYKNKNGLVFTTGQTDELDAQATNSWIGINIKIRSPHPPIATQTNCR